MSQQALIHWHVLGAGSLGGLMASRLALAENPVTLLLKDQVALDEFERTGLVLETEDDSINIANGRVCVENAREASSELDYILVATKAYDVISALNSISHRLTPNTTILLMQNGMGIYEEVVEAFPKIKILIGITSVGAYRTAKFHIVHTGHGPICVGDPLDQTDLQEQHNICHSLSTTGFNTTWTDDINFYLWEKLAINCAINPVTVIYDCLNGELLDNQDARSLMQSIVAEVENLMEKQGFAPKTNALIDSAVEVAKRTAKNYSSMLQDVQNGRLTEIAYINGYINEQAKTLGIDTPYNQFVADQICQKSPSTL